MIVTPSADLELAVRAIVFAAVGTAGQRCTTLRRLIVHEDVYDDLIARLEKAYVSVPVGDPREPTARCVGPLVTRASFERHAGGARAGDGRRRRGVGRRPGRWPTSSPTRFYVRAGAGADARPDRRSSRRRRSRRMLYAMRYRELDEAIALHNDVPQGLSSCIFTNDLREAEQFLSAAGSRLRHRERQHRPVRRRDRRRVRRREGDGRRPRVRLGRLEGVHAPADRHDQLLARAAARAGHEVRRRLAPARGVQYEGLTPNVARSGSDPVMKRLQSPRRSHDVARSVRHW